MNRNAAQVFKPYLCWPRPGETVRHYYKYIYQWLCSRPMEDIAEYCRLYEVGAGELAAQIVAERMYMARQDVVDAVESAEEENDDDADV